MVTFEFCMSCISDLHISHASELNNHAVELCILEPRPDELLQCRGPELNDEEAKKILNNLKNPSKMIKNYNIS